MRITFTYPYYTEASMENGDCEDHGFYQPEYDSWHSVRKRKSVNKKIQRKKKCV